MSIKPTYRPLFAVRAEQPIYWPDGTVMVPAGTTGSAIMRFGGQRPGWMVQWDGRGICAVSQSSEGREWKRVTIPRPDRPIRLH